MVLKMRVFKKFVCCLFFTLIFGSVFPEEWKKEYRWENPELVENFIKKTDLKDNFAIYVNYDWYKKYDFLPSGWDEVNVFAEIQGRMAEKVFDLIINEDGTLVSKLQKEYFNQVLEYISTFNVDVSPVASAIQKVIDAKNLDEITDLLKTDRAIIASSTFFDADVMDDFCSAKKYICVLLPTNLLYDSAVFLNLSPAQITWLQNYSKMIAEFLKTCGVNKDQAKSYSDSLIEVQIELAKHKRPDEDGLKKDWLKSIYNVYPFEKIKNDFKNFPLAEILASRGYDTAKDIQISEPDFMKGLDDFYVAENFEKIKGYIVCRLAEIFTDYGNKKHQKILKKYNKKVGWYKNFSKINKVDYAFSLAVEKFANSLGKRYMEKYLSSELKERIEDIIKNHTAIYRERLKNATWLSEKTRKTAIEKLDAMTYVVGEPENIPDATEFFGELGKDFLETYIMLKNLEETKIIQKALSMPYNEAFESGENTALTLNAFNDWTKNRIFISAAILQEPFYSDGYSDEELLGGIGAVIGHEISHSFDAIGSQFDKDGNIVNWWTSEDKAAFDKLNDAVEDYYGHFVILPDIINKDEGTSLNGELTVTENVADLGGISCCLDQMRMLKETGKNPDYKKFFESYARVWVSRGKSGFYKNLIMNDKHSPSYIRVNAVVQQFQEFYDTYGIKEGDAMYLAPEKRLKVW